MNITRSKSDWWQWKWRLGDNQPKGALDNWVFDPKLTDFKKPHDMRDAMALALTNIASESNNLVLFLSGGVDSESILIEAITQGIFIQPVFMRFNDQLNQHEEYYVYKIANKLGITVDIIDVDIQSWIHRDRSVLSWHHINSEWGYKHPVPGVLMWLRHQVAQRYGDVTVIHGNGDLPIYGFSDPCNISNKVWTINYCWQANFATLKYYYHNYPTDIPYFYSYSPELVYSFMKDIDTHNLLTPDVKFSSNSRSHLFKILFPDQITRPKYHGWETVWQRYSEMPRTQTIASQNPEPYTYMDYQEFYELLGRYAHD